MKYLKLFSWSLVTMALAITAFAVFPTETHAQAYPCSSPGPGEQIVGMTQSGNGVASVPLCERTDNGSSDPGGGGYWANRYATVVWARDQNGQPTYTWATNGADQASADNRAMQACQEEGYTDCRVADGFFNGYLAIVRAQDGSLYVSSAFKEGDAKKGALRQCRDDQRGKCKVVEVQRSQAVWIGR